MNNTVITGRVGKDAEVRHLDNGRAAIGFSLAWSEKYKNNQGEKQERTIWYDCTIWRKSDAVGVAQYIKKGSQLLIQGEVGARSWQNDAGEIKTSLTVNVRDLEFISTPREDGAAPQAQPQAQQQAQGSTYQPPKQESPFANAGASPEFFTSSGEDDLPF